MEGWTKECLSDITESAEWLLNDRECSTCQIHLQKGLAFSIIKFKGLEMKDIQVCKNGRWHYWPRQLTPDTPY